MVKEQDPCEGRVASLGLSVNRNQSVGCDSNGLGVVDVTQDICKKTFGDCLTIQVIIGGVRTDCLLDMGSEVTTVNGVLLQEAFQRWRFATTKCSLGATYSSKRITNPGIRVP